MAESSTFWTTSGVGDGIALGDEELALWLSGLVASKQANEGVLAGLGSQLAVTAGSGNVTLADGAALVNGYYYQNTAGITFAIPTPGAGTTGHCLVLRQDQVAQTVRAALKSSSEGNSTPPSPEQDSSIWEICLASIAAKTDGSITITDMRDYCHRQPALAYRRKGGSSSDWTKAGATTYNPAGVRIQSGVGSVVFSGDEDSKTASYSFPVSYAQKPLVFLTLVTAGVTNATRVKIAVSAISTTGFSVQGHRVDNANWTQTLSFMWLAIGQ